jgi:hypothetical protein
MRATESGRKAQLESTENYGGRNPGESAEAHLRRIAESATYPLVNDVAAEVLQLLGRLEAVEAELAELRGR